MILKYETLVEENSIFKHYNYENMLCIIIIFGCACENMHVYVHHSITQGYFKYGNLTSKMFY